MNQLSQTELENLIAEFNKKYPVGTKVIVSKWKNSTETFIDEIKHEATIMGGHSAMTWLKGRGSYDLTFVKSKIEQEVKKKRIIELNVTFRYELEIDDENAIVKEYPDERNMLMDCASYHFGKGFPVIGTEGVKVLDVQLEDIDF